MGAPGCSPGPLLPPATPPPLGREESSAFSHSGLSGGSHWPRTECSLEPPRGGAPLAPTRLPSLSARAPRPQGLSLVAAGLGSCVVCAAARCRLSHSPGAQRPFILWAVLRAPPQRGPRRPCPARRPPVTARRPLTPLRAGVRVGARVLSGTPVPPADLSVIAPMALSTAPPCLPDARTDHD